MRLRMVWQALRGRGVIVDFDGDGYATFSSKVIARTAEAGPLLVDLADDGTIVGIEVMGVDKPFVERPDFLSRGGASVDSDIDMAAGWD